jgi:hypothetical protein
MADFESNNGRGAPYFLKVYGAALGSRASGRGRETDPFPHPTHDGDAEITQDLFLTKWSSIPGEFEATLAPTVDFGETIYLGSKRI